MIKESIKMSWKNIVHNKMRSFLTTLGIVIGVTAIIALITIVEGVNNEMNSQFASLGAGKITVLAYGTPLKQGLNDNDLQKLLEIDNVLGISPTLSMDASVVRDSLLEENVVVEGKNDVYFRHNSELILKGRDFNILDMENKNRVAIINQDLERILFFGEDSLGKDIQINGITYQVVGVLDEAVATDVMSVMETRMGKKSDGKAIIPYRTAMGMAGISNISSLEILIDDTNRTDEVIKDTENVLNEAFNYKDDSYTVINLDSLLDAMDTMSNMMTTMLAGIASIALLVGGIGIMNMMLVSVTERTTEIGLRKALGATPGSIQLQFLIESIFLSLLGGFIGLVLGVSLSWAVTTLLGIPFQISTGAITLGVGFSASVGIIFGWAPARNASKLDPIDALRSV
ncbi:ABC transporter permease [Paratissierella segnis]|uniref:ABC transporter permease n=1 Tax=Paratissierella segnis TaxID=2763679 RepID=A0A926EWE7_9FIRM|nr:ABC transporter permease [Paratissierella segnis]MBC8587544.1 ABC transporter permease [Paratissierella segnis]